GLRRKGCKATRNARGSLKRGVRTTVFPTGEDSAMSELPERTPSEGLPAWLGPIVLGIAVAALLRFGVGAIQVSSGEPLLLRWARILADHPLRAGLAAALALVVLRPRPPSP